MPIRKIVKENELQRDLNRAVETFFESIRKIIHAEVARQEPSKILTLRNKFGLSKRLHEILLYVLDGFQDKEIGQRLNISTSTVRYHVGIILKKHEVSSRHDLQKFY